LLQAKAIVLSYSNEVVLVLLLILGSVGFAQVSGDASGLIRAISDSANETGAWRIEGSIKRGDSDASFVLQMQSPDQIRYEQKGGATPAVIVCNSSIAWLYSPPVNAYRKFLPNESPVCSLIVGEWKRLPETLEGPKLVGKGSYIIEGKSKECQLVRGISKPLPESAGSRKRTLCVDQKRNLIAWEKTESKDGSETFTYSRIEQGASYLDSTFTFEPPAGSKLTDLQLPTPGPLGSHNIPRVPGVSLPRILSNLEPGYDEDSRRAKIEGIVVLYVVIDDRGLPSEIYLLKPLSPGLDANATSSVKKWRFSPAMKDGKPISYGATIEVKFRLT
jgi:TonB family protein